MEGEVNDSRRCYFETMYIKLRTGRVYHVYAHMQTLMTPTSVEIMIRVTRY